MYTRIDPTHLTELDIRAPVRKLCGARFPDEPVVGNAGWVSVSTLCSSFALVSWAPGCPSSCPHQPGQRPARPLLLIPASCWPPWGSHGLRCSGGRFCSPLFQALLLRCIVMSSGPSTLHWSGRSVREANEDRCTAVNKDRAEGTEIDKAESGREERGWELFSELSPRSIRFDRRSLSSLSNLSVSSASLPRAASLSLFLLRRRSPFPFCRVSRVRLILSFRSFRCRRCRRNNVLPCYSPLLSPRKGFLVRCSQHHRLLLLLLLLLLFLELHRRTLRSKKISQYCIEILNDCIFLVPPLNNVHLEIEWADIHFFATRQFHFFLWFSSFRRSFSRLPSPFSVTYSITAFVAFLRRVSRFPGPY